MAKPYVYRCEHKISGRFYIGYRKANSMSAKFDLGTYYFTSCPEVRNNFNEYTYKILGEFKYAATAFEVEQKLISESRNNPLLINKQWKHTKILIDQDITIRSLANHIPRVDKLTGDVRLVKHRKKKKKIHISTEAERLGLTYAQEKERMKLVSMRNSRKRQRAKLRKEERRLRKLQPK